MMLRRICVQLMGVALAAGVAGALAGAPASAHESRHIEHAPYVDIATTLRDASLSAQTQETISLQGLWRAAVDVKGVGMQKGWSSPRFNDSKWVSVEVPGNLPKALLQGGPIAIWLRCNVTAPKGWSGTGLHLAIDGLDARDAVWFNGRLLKTVPESTADFGVPADVVKAGNANSVVVRYVDPALRGGLAAGARMSLARRAEPGAAPSRSREKSGDSTDRVNVGGGVVVEAGESVKDAVAVMGTLTVRGTVRGDATAVMGNVVVEPGGRVEGDAVSVGGRVIRKEGGVIGGAITNVSPSGLPMAPFFTLPLFGFSAMWHLWLALLFIPVAVFVVALFPERMECVARIASGQPGESLGYGLLGLLLVVPVGAVLLITCIGIPRIPVEAVLVVAAWYVGSIGVALAAGWKLMAAFGKPVPSAVAAVAIGALAFALMRMVPVAGSVVVLLLNTVGVGAVIMTGFGSSPEWLHNRFAKRWGTPPPTAPAVPPGVPPAAA